ILDERGRELLWEAHRRTDLIRFGEFTGGDYVWSWKGGTQSGVATDSFRDLYPLPASELVANPNLTQNPGYLSRFARPEHRAGSPAARAAGLSAAGRSSCATRPLACDRRRPGRDAPQRPCDGVWFGRFSPRYEPTAGHSTRALADLSSLGTRGGRRCRRAALPVELDRRGHGVRERAWPGWVSRRPRVATAGACGPEWRPVVGTLSTRELQHCTHEFRHGGAVSGHGAAMSLGRRGHLRGCRDQPHERGSRRGEQRDGLHEVRLSRSLRAE